MSAVMRTDKSLLSNLSIETAWVWKPIPGLDNFVITGPARICVDAQLRAQLRQVAVPHASYNSAIFGLFVDGNLVPGLDGRTNDSCIAVNTSKVGTVELNTVTPSWEFDLDSGSHTIEIRGMLECYSDDTVAHPDGKRPAITAPDGQSQDRFIVVTAENGGSFFCVEVMSN